MKTNFSNSVSTIIRKTILIMICAAGLMTANANTNSNFSEKDPTVTSLGIVKGEMVFNLKYENVDGDKLEVVLIDQEGSRLYRQIFTDKDLNRTFKVPADIESFVVRVTNLKTKVEQKFELSTTRRTIEDVVVTSIK
jgi:hypothetical protein